MRGGRGVTEKVNYNCYSDVINLTTSTHCIPSAPVYADGNQVADACIFDVGISGTPSVRYQEVIADGGTVAPVLNDEMRSMIGNTLANARFDILTRDG